MAAMADWQELVRKTMKKEKCTYREAQQTAKPIWQKLKKKESKRCYESNQKRYR